MSAKASGAASSGKRKLRVLKKYGLNTAWHPESTLVFKSRKDRAVIGRIASNQFLELDETALDLCEEWSYEPDPELVADEDENGEEPGEPDESEDPEDQPAPSPEEDEPTVQPTLSPDEQAPEENEPTAQPESPVPDPTNDAEEKVVTVESSDSSDDYFVQNALEINDPTSFNDLFRQLLRTTNYGSDLIAARHKDSPDPERFLALQETVDALRQNNQQLTTELAETRSKLAVIQSLFGPGDK